LDVWGVKTYTIRSIQFAAQGLCPTHAGTTKIAAPGKFEAETFASTAQKGSLSL